jgi:hypothetical protein
VKKYTIQILTRYDAFANKLLRSYFTVEWRRVEAASADAATSLVHLGPYEAIGKVCANP